MKQQITIVGAGIIGLCSAYYLHKKGYDVQIIDKGDLSDNCSYGNAGMIVPSHFVPLAAPGMIGKGLRWMFNSESPFYIKPRLDKRLMRWGWLFYRHATPEHVQRSIPLLKNYNSLSKNLFREIYESKDFDFSFEQKGLLMLCRTEKGAEEEQELAELAEQHGVSAKWYAKEDLKNLEPNIQLDVVGGLHFPGDAHVVPQQFMQGIKRYLKKVGVLFWDKEEVLDFEIQKGKITSIITNKTKRSVEQLLIAGGAWSAQLLENLKIKLPLQGGKGYSFEIELPNSIQIPSILSEAKVAVTPMANKVRFAGTMEINGVNLDVNTKRVQGIQKAIAAYYPTIKPQETTRTPTWRGLRPCSPDGLPYLGKVKDFENLTVATGHAMMGLSMGPATGLLVSELIEEATTQIDISLLQPQRF